MTEFSDITINMPPGAAFVSHPLLYGSTILRLTREGMGYNLTSAFSPGKPEYLFKTTGLTAYRIIFSIPASPGGEKIHVIYKR